MALQEKVFTAGDLAWQSWSRSYVLKVILSEESASISDNTSRIYYKVQLISGANNRFNGYDVNCSLNIDGQNLHDVKRDVNQPYNHTTDITSGYATVGHDSDGGKNLSFSCTINTNYNLSYLPPSMTLNGNFQLSNIARGSVPSLSNGTISVGQSVTIYTNAASSDFTHSLTYKVENGSWHSIADGVGSAYAWNVPLSLAGEIPDSTSGRITISCTTYSGSREIGSNQVSANLYIPNTDGLKPYISNAGVTETAHLPDAFSGILIQGISRIRASADISTPYSNLKSVIWKIGGKTYSGKTVESDITFSGIEDAVVTATDTRGYSASQNVRLPVVSYSKPYLGPGDGSDKIICERSDASGNPQNGGRYLLVKCRRNYSPINYHNRQNNFCEVLFRVKSSASASYGREMVLLAKDDLSTDSIHAILPDVVSDNVLAYSVQILLRETIGTENVYTFNISTEDVDFHLREKGHGAAFGKYSTEQYALESAWNIHAYKDVTIDGTLHGQYMEPRDEVFITDADNALKPGVYSMDNCQILNHGWFGILVVFSTGYGSGNAGRLQIAASHTGAIAMRTRWYEVNPWGPWKEL